MEGEVEIMLTEVQLEPRVAGELRWGGMERGTRFGGCRREERGQRCRKHGRRGRGGALAELSRV